VAANCRDSPRLAVVTESMDQRPGLLSRLPFRQGIAVGLDALRSWHHFSRVQVREPPIRPMGISALAIFFALGSMIALTASLALLFPGGMLEPMWRLNPRARLAFGSIGGWGPVLLAVLSLACSATAVGLWKGWRWGYRLALGLLIVQLAGNLTNVLLGTEPRAAVGIPLAALLIWFLSRNRVRAFFRSF
jgi:hypothetical protein